MRNQYLLDISESVNYRKYVISKTKWSWWSEAEILRFLHFTLSAGIWSRQDLFMQQNTGTCKKCSERVSKIGDHFLWTKIWDHETMWYCSICNISTMVVKQEYYTPEKQVTIFRSATPRDIDPKLSDDSKVNLINLDTIKEISKANQSERQELCRQSNTMISKAKKNDAV